MSAFLTMAERCGACALANTPPNVRRIRIRKDLSGFACVDPKFSNYGTLCAPRPITRKALHIFLHECAHFALHTKIKGRARKHRYIEEYEAERWASARMREAGIAVPRAITKRAKSHVRRQIEQAGPNLKALDARAAKYAGVQVS
jgi:hypothetical protein